MKTIGALGLLVVFGLCSLWFVLTQPFVGGGGMYLTQPRADVGVLKKHVRRITETGFRDVAHPRHLDSVSAYIAGKLVSLGIRAEMQPFMVGDEEYRNMIAHLGPEEGSKIIVGAHYDVCGEQPGADDNASGVAALLEVARLLSQTELKHPVDLVFYTLEEPPHFRTDKMGSAVHADSVKDDDIKAMICLEMLGYYTDDHNSQAYPIAPLKLLYPDQGNFIAVISRIGDAGLTRQVKRSMRATSTVPTVSMNAPAAIPGVDFSDHLNYWAHDIPAVMITDTAFYRNPNYHEPTDTPDTLDYKRMAQVVDGVANAVLALAMAD